MPIAAENVNVAIRATWSSAASKVRVQNWIALSVDVQYTHVPGILGTAGISKDVGENDLGGIAVRVKVIVGE